MPEPLIARAREEMRPSSASDMGRVSGVEVDDTRPGNDNARR
jgi:hypothetical protein